MDNIIVKDTWDLWKEEITDYIEMEDKLNAEFIAEKILKYLQDEGAFTLVEED